MRSWRAMGCLISASLLLSTVFFLGCRIQSGDSAVRGVGVNISGLYRGNGPLVRQNSGAPISELNVIQDGDRLQAVDNNGLVFRGNIGRVTMEGGSASATFNLKGNTTAGAEGIMSGSFTVEGTTSTMRGTWAEPTLFSTFLGTATVEPLPEPEPGPEPEPEPDPAPGQAPT